ncbi:MAG: hypothetical protein GY937_05255 [bacterium]|nr:hypothetical protein [bacterium]
MSADPIGQFGLLTKAGGVYAVAGANQHSYVASRPLYWIDPYGLSERDVRKIKKWAKKHYGNRQASGQSSSVPPGSSEPAARARGAVTNLCSNLPGTSCEGCGDAANDTVSEFNESKDELGLDDDWTIEPVDDSDGPLYPQNGDPTQTNILPHSTTNITSSNPSDPNIRVDAHRSQTRVQR